MSIKEKAIINAIQVDELSEAKNLISNNLLERISNRIEELKNNTNLLEKKKEEVEEEDTEYQKFFKKALKKFGAESPDELEGEKKKEFFDYVDKNWKADKETD